MLFYFIVCLTRVPFIIIIFKIEGFTLLSKCKIIEEAESRALKENPTCKVAPTNLWANGHLRFFIMKGKSCAICKVNEYSGGNKQLDWICCKVCNAGWCCSEKQWKKYKRKHTAQICHSYQQNTALELFQRNHMKQYDEDFKHFPQETLPTRLTTFPSSWDEYFLLRFKEMYIMGHQQGCVPPEFFPCSTRILSQGHSLLKFTHFCYQSYFVASLTLPSCNSLYLCFYFTRSNCSIWHV